MTPLTQDQLQGVGAATEYMLSRRMFWFDSTGSHVFFESSVAVTLNDLRSALKAAVANNAAATSMWVTSYVNACFNSF